jgi:putative ABC transport system substrate-binding protein
MLHMGSERATSVALCRVARNAQWKCQKADRAQSSQIQGEGPSQLHRRVGRVITRRRIALAFAAGALVAPVASRAQWQPTKVARIGFLGLASSTGWATRVDALREGLRDLGYVEGRNIFIEFRWAEGKYDRLPSLADELVRLGVDVLVTAGTPGTLAAKRATSTIPIVMAVSGDAIATGIVDSLARPGGNITGSTFFDPEMTAKRLEVLKEAIPRLAQVAVLLNPDNPGSTGPVLKAMQIAAESKKIALLRFEVLRPNEFDSAFAAMVQRRVDAVAIFDDAMFLANARAIADIAANNRLPLIGNREIVEAGGLIGYGVNTLELWRRAAYFVDRILKGARPSDLPVEQATKFELLVNLKTANALGITIPQSLLLRADKVIQ